jgi:glycosyltransferase involved in cell wall biosynthesis
MLLENEPYPADVRVRSEALALTGAGYRVKVICPRRRGQPRRETVHGVEVERYWCPEAGGSPASLAIEYLIANLQLHARGLRELCRGARVLHLHNPPDTLFGLAWVARALGRKVVFDHHDLAPELFAVKFGRRLGPLRWLVGSLEVLSLRSATHVIAANESHRDVAVGRGRVRPTSVTVVRNGPPAGSVSDTPPAGGALSEPRLVFVGAMAPQDGVEELADVLFELERRHRLRASLVAVGDGPSRPGLQRRGVELGVADRIRLPGRVEPEEVPGVLADADICLDPAPCNALNHASTMVKVAEYLAAGRPLVAYRLRETQRTVGDAALLADCGDRDGFVERVSRLAADGALRLDLAARGRQRVRALTWEHSREALVTAYAQL